MDCHEHIEAPLASERECKRRGLLAEVDQFIACVCVRVEPLVLVRKPFVKHCLLMIAFTSFGDTLNNSNSNMITAGCLVSCPYGQGIVVETRPDNVIVVQLVGSAYKAFFQRDQLLLTWAPQSCRSAMEVEEVTESRAPFGDLPSSKRQRC
jgi:hypothetical protein